MKEIKNVNLVLENEVVFGDLIIENGKIKEIISKGNFKSDALILVPGFVDIHIHGGYSYDVMDATFNANESLALNLPKEGTTSFLAATMTQSNENISKALKAIGNYYTNQNKNSAKLLGVHLEGPYVNINAAGAQPIQYIKNPDLEEFKKWNEDCGNIIKKVSLAPEIDTDFIFTKYLVENNITPSIAHTTANYQQTIAAIKAGFSSFTHTFNAMTKFHHRDVGVVGAAFLEKEILSEIIFDKVHFSLEAGKILLNNKTYKNLALITDSMRNKGLADGVSELGGQTVYINGNQAKLKDGTLAGSILKMIDGYKNLVNDLELKLFEASCVASLNPAKSLNLDNQIGSIKENKFADLVLLDQNLNVLKTFINGRVVFEKNKQ